MSLASLNAAIATNIDETIELKAVRLKDGVIIQKWYAFTRWGLPAFYTALPSKEHGPCQVYYRRAGRNRWFKLVPPTW